MMRFISVVIFLLGQLAVNAQADQATRLRFGLYYGLQPVKPGEQENYLLADGDSIQFEIFRSYISGVGFYKNGVLVFEEENSYHLLDAAAGETMVIDIQLPPGISYDAIGFNLGIDSVTNTSGALDGALDPLHGMYWAWQTGYINMKLEGRSALCPTRNHVFQFHLGGYMQPYYALQRVILPVPPAHVINIALPLDKFVAAINLSKQHTVMMPCVEAVLLSKQVASLWEIRQ